MSRSHPIHSRRAEIHRNRPDGSSAFWPRLKASGALGSLLIVGAFWGLAMSILLFRQDVMAYRPGQYVRQAIYSRVPFAFRDKDLLINAQKEARENEPHVYKPNGDAWAAIEQWLKQLPEMVGDQTLEHLPLPYRNILDSGAVTALKQAHQPERQAGYKQAVEAYMLPLRKLVVLSEDQRQQELRANMAYQTLTPRAIQIPSLGRIDLENTYSNQTSPELEERLQKSAFENFREELQLKIVKLTLERLSHQPTHLLDEDATAEAQNLAAQRVPASRGQFTYATGQIIKSAGKLDDRDWQLLKAEHEAFLKTLDNENLVEYAAGTAGVAGIIAIALGGYIGRHQSRVVKNHARGLAIALLLLATLLLAELAALGTGPLYLLGTAPTILVAMILAVAYDQRFAAGMATLHGLLVTVGVNQSIGFFLILLAGVLTCCFLLDDIRTRGKLIEVGGLTALAMTLTTAAVGLFSLEPLEPLRYIIRNSLYAGGAGLAIGFLVLGILPFIEKIFRITTSMTLLELADVSQPLLRRMAMEAPGTYAHCLQVATLAEAAADAVGANSLMCRVGAYYHDIGKMNKAEYFCENQSDGRNRHLNLSPNVSLLIIVGHVKDGVELAREYTLPTVVSSFIQQHHGTTLVEYFYYQACTQSRQVGGVEQPPIREEQYRYPGPKPRSKEIAIVMIADIVESAARAMTEPTASRIEMLVHDLVMKRMLDGQFNECDLTLRDLNLIEKACAKTLLGIYHGRIAYPSLTGPLAAATAGTSVRTA